MASNVARNSPVVMATLEKNIFEHISLMAQEQLEVEFREENTKIDDDAATNTTKSSNGTKSTGSTTDDADVNGFRV